MSPSRSELDKLKAASKAMDAIAYGGLIEKEIRTSNNWSLLPLQAAFSSVMPGSYMNGNMSWQVMFPSMLGRMSTINRKDRLLQELKMHMNLKVTGSKTSLYLDYLEPLRDSLLKPLIKDAADGIEATMDKLESYCLKKEDMDSIIELTLWDKEVDPYSKVDSKVKAALTRTYNKQSFNLPYSLGTISKGKKRKASFDGEDGGEDDGLEIVEEEEENEDDIELDASIKAKKKKTTNAKSNDEDKNKSKPKSEKPKAKASKAKKTK